jgi:hypothetical protein
MFARPRHGVPAAATPVVTQAVPFHVSTEQQLPSAQESHWDAALVQVPALQ